MGITESLCEEQNAGARRRESKLDLLIIRNAGPTARKKDRCSFLYLVHLTKGWWTYMTRSHCLDVVDGVDKADRPRFEHVQRPRQGGKPPGHQRLEGAAQHAPQLLLERAHNNVNPTCLPSSSCTSLLHRPSANNKALGTDIIQRSFVLLPASSSTVSQTSERPFWNFITYFMGSLSGTSGSTLHP